MISFKHVDSSQCNDIAALLEGCPDFKGMSRNLAVIKLQILLFESGTNKVILGKDDDSNPFAICVYHYKTILPSFKTLIF